MSWYPNHASLGYRGIDCDGSIKWSGSSNGRNSTISLDIYEEEMAEEIMQDLQEAIEEGYYDS